MSTRSMRRSRRALGSLLLGFGLTACGQGGDGAPAALAETSTAAPPAAVVPPAAPAAPAAAEPRSTAMSANAVDNGFDFSQYTDYVVDLDLPALGAELAGDLYVVKLSDDTLQTYFLGTVNELKAMNLVVSVPRATERLWLELFTNDPDAGVVLEELVL